LGLGFLVDRATGSDAAGLAIGLSTAIALPTIAELATSR